MGRVITDGTPNIPRVANTTFYTSDGRRNDKKFDPTPIIYNRLRRKYNCLECYFCDKCNPINGCKKLNEQVNE